MQLGQQDASLKENIFAVTDSGVVTQDGDKSDSLSLQQIHLPSASSKCTNYLTSEK